MTGGTKVGVMQLVGEAVREYNLEYTPKNPIILLGIAPWGIVANRDSLLDTDVRLLGIFDFMDAVTLIVKLIAYLYITSLQAAVYPNN